MLASVVIVTYNSAAYIRSSLSSIAETGCATVVVDNGSKDDTTNVIRAEFPDVRLIASGENLGYGRALNLGIRECTSDFVVAANADVVFPKGSLQQMVQFISNNDSIAVVGAQLVFPDGSWQRSYGAVPGLSQAVKSILGLTSLTHLARRAFWPRALTSAVTRVGYVDGAVMLIRKAAFEGIGGFDEDFAFYAEDADLCLRLQKAGWETVVLPNVRVVHVRGGSSTKLEGYSDRFLRAQASANCLFVRKHCPRWHSRVYVAISKLHAKKSWLMFKMLRICAPAAMKEQFDAMAAIFRRESRAWEEMN